MDNLATLEISIRKEFPDFELIPKSKSLRMKIINVFLKIITFGQMKAFMDDFLTTDGYKVYTPNNWDKYAENMKIVSLRHERVHMRQFKKYTSVLFRFLYLFFPLPFLFAYFRAKFEMEAYEESMRAMFDYYGGYVLDDGGYRRRMIGHFTTHEYLWMWPWNMDKWYDNIVKKIRAEKT